jgi:hypothetical protein
MPDVLEGKTDEVDEQAVNRRLLRDFDSFRLNNLALQVQAFNSITPTIRLRMTLKRSLHLR